MANRRTTSLRTKISVVTTATVIVVALILGGLNIYNQLDRIRTIEERFLHDSVRSAAALSYTVMPFLASGNFVYMNNLASNYAQRSDRLYVVVVDTRNRILASSETGKIGATFQSPSAYRTDKIGEGIVRRFTQSGLKAVEVSYPIRAGDLVIGNVVMGLNMNWLQEETGGIRKTIMISAAVVAGLISLGILLANALAKRVSEPMNLLTRAAEKVGRGDYSQEINVQSNDEVGTLADAFNTMLGELRSARTQLVEKNYLDSILATMGDALIVAGPEGRIEMVNRATLNLLGYRQEELAGSRLKTIISGAPFGEVSNEDLIGQGLETSLLTKDGQMIPVLLSGAMLESDGRMKRIVCVAKDISERKRAEEALLQSEERYRSVVENVSTGIAVISPKMEILSINSTMKSWFPDLAVQEKPLCYRSFYQPPRDAICSYCPTFLTLGDGQVHETITETTLEGKKANHRVLSSPIRDKSGNIIAAIEMVENITERRRAEEAVRVSEARLKDAQHIAQIGNWEWDIVHDRVQWSEELYRIYGYEPYEITPDFKRIVESMHPRSKDAFVGAIDAALKAGRPFEMDYTFFRRDGSEAIMHTIGRVNYDDKGSPVRMAGTAQDVTELKNLQTRLEEKTAEQNTILENTLAGIAFLKERKFVWFNSKMEQMFGYPYDEMSGLTTEAFYPSREEYEQLGAAAYPSLAAGEPYNTERLMKRKDGSLFWCSLSGKAIDPSALSKGSIWILQDITQRRSAEERIKASLLEKDILLKEVHHRVKNNLQVVSSMLRLQSKHLEDRKAKAMFEDSQRRVESMSLMHEKLYRSKDLARIDFREYIGGLVGNMRALNAGGSNRIEIREDIGEVMLDVNKGIPCGLLINELVSNALRHAFPAGRDGVVVVSMHSDRGGGTSLVVSDNGTGFPEHIDFRNTKSLGMQLVTSLVGQLDGTIEMDNRKGTAFAITFQA